MSKLRSVARSHNVQHYIHIMTHSDMFSPEKAFPGAETCLSVNTIYRQIWVVLGKVYWLVYFLRLKNCNGFCNTS